jgi:hypothetical protein
MQSPSAPRTGFVRLVQEAVMGVKTPFWDQPAAEQAAPGKTISTGRERETGTAGRPSSIAEETETVCPAEGVGAA